GTRYVTDPNVTLHLETLFSAPIMGALVILAIAGALAVWAVLRRSAAKAPSNPDTPAIQPIDSSDSSSTATTSSNTATRTPVEAPAAARLAWLAPVVANGAAHSALVVDRPRPSSETTPVVAANLPMRDVALPRDDGAAAPVFVARQPILDRHQCLAA